MKKLGIILGIILMVFLVGGTRAISPIEELQGEIDKLSASLEMSRKATAPLETELIKLRTKLTNIQEGIDKAKAELRNLEISISQRQKEFGENYVLLAERATSFYKTSRQNSSLLILFTNGSVGGIMRDLFYRRVATDRDKAAIETISQQLIQLETDKKTVEINKIKLAELQAKLDKEAKFFEKEISGAKAYQAQLTVQISSLQQKIIAQKLGSLNLPQSLGAGAMICTDDRNLDPKFGTGFAFYTFGIPHRVGLNQYGAYGRAASQGYEEILRAYFANFTFENRPNIDIDVQGYGRMPLETYLLGIYEMPESWPMEALKAQAVTARSYALAYTNNGAGSICTNQNCQVYKQPAKSGPWKEAVEQTAGKVMVSGGEVVKAWYSSTDGGYTFTSGDVWGTDKQWTKRMRDTSGEVNSFEQLKERAYDKESKCFYAAQGWRNEYGKSAWLKPEEVADIANVMMLVKKKPEVACFVFQPDQPPPVPDKNCPKTDNWNFDKVRQELGGDALSRANAVEISGVDWGGGRTTQVKINGIAFDGNEFKNYFNVRAPANIQIVGPLYNVEKR